MRRPNSTRTRENRKLKTTPIDGVALFFGARWKRGLPCAGQSGKGGRGHFALPSPPFCYLACMLTKLREEDPFLRLSAKDTSASFRSSFVTPSKFHTWRKNPCMEFKKIHIWNLKMDEFIIAIHGMAFNGVLGTYRKQQTLIPCCSPVSKEPYEL